LECFEQEARLLQKAAAAWTVAGRQALQQQAWQWREAALAMQRVERLRNIQAFDAGRTP
jgi:hypothetical protein